MKTIHAFFQLSPAPLLAEFRANESEGLSDETREEIAATGTKLLAERRLKGSLMISALSCVYMRDWTPN